VREKGAEAKTKPGLPDEGNRDEILGVNFPAPAEKDLFQAKARRCLVRVEKETSKARKRISTRRTNPSLVRGGQVEREWGGPGQRREYSCGKK